MAKYGLIGRNIEYSFSRSFFTVMFERENIPDSYVNFDINNIEEFPGILEREGNLGGFNVTIPYKESIIPYLDELDREARKIGAVNTIKIGKDGKLIGYNTDHYGFAKALSPYLPLEKNTALILGTGGASKAISYVLKAMNFDYTYVSRTPSQTSLTYNDLTREIIEKHLLIVNTTPLGTSPDTDICPDIPYHYLGPDHVLFDLIYNPQETEFMKRGIAASARVSNGRFMLEFQAMKAWAIWNS